ncbi:hypothetical protein [Cytobacillus horneckiae]|uniref:hypothetical protein n=1 Tax=Cytobacillus horneckiae TaxID=549687 RepID=UPI000B1E85FB|nr:hypothetical protein [Cytobacillus horneckiae]MEC1157998.1 hypothetical protein [Cytobacillus horneckiae]MED2937077.1 hypothetical protein [Cytobacillus horneckiae]
MSNHNKLSVFISLILRHKPEVISIKLGHDLLSPFHMGDLSCPKDRNNLLLSQNRNDTFYNHSLHLLSSNP